MDLTKNYSMVRFSPSIFYLYLNRLLIQVGVGIYGIFGVIFLYEQFNNSVEQTLIFYFIFYTATILVSHLGAKLIGKVGMRNMMIIAIIFLIGSTLSLFFWDADPALFLILYFISATLYKMFYWVPFHVEFAAFTDKKMRGKQMAVLSNVSEIFLAILPIIGGLVITYEGYETVFLISTVIIAFSIIPLFYMRETKEHYTWSFKKLISEIFEKSNRSMVLANIGNGFQGAVGMIVWPIFIFIVLEGSYSSVGIITSLTIVVLITLRFIAGNFLDTIGKEKVIRLSSFADMTGWVAKAFIESATGVFFVHTYHRFTRVIQRLSYDTETYEQAADNGHYIDEYTVLKETTLMIGRSFMFVIALVVISFFSVQIVFIIAALATLLMTFISRKTQIS